MKGLILMKNLEQYMKENFEKGAIDHALRAHVNAAGDVTFYIHAAGHNSDTLDFKVEENNLIPCTNNP